MSFLYVVLICRAYMSCLTLNAKQVEPELRDMLTARVYEVVRARCLLGNFLHSQLTESSLGVSTAHTWSTLFTSPLTSLSKFPIQLLILLVGICFVPSLHKAITAEDYFEITHLRFEVLEVRASTAQGPQAPGVERLDLLLDNCNVTREVWSTETKGASLLVTLAGMSCLYVLLTCLCLHVFAYMSLLICLAYMSCLYARELQCDTGGWDL